tara:strand:- start:524 stop:1510 length:987 start_codon:yes stop_codon:yes gene_type:complete
MKICFVDKTKSEYSFKDINSYEIRGAESILINFSKELSKMGHEVVVFNNCKDEYISNSYTWINLNKISNYKNSFDIVISNNETSCLSNFNCKKKFVISHSIQTIEKFIRQNQFFSYIKNKPIFLLIGKYHEKKMSKLFSIYGTRIIRYGVDEIFEKKELLTEIDNDLSYFTSRQDRNLDVLLNTWKENIISNRPASKLYITPIKDNLESSNIYNRKMLNRSDFINEIIKSRMIIIPGHKAELFCLSALEASELCIPIVTMGIGSLSERVEHGVTGLISKNKSEFAKNILEIYNNDDLWSEIRSNLKNRRGQNSWNLATINFFDTINLK